MFPVWTWVTRILISTHVTTPNNLNPYPYPYPLTLTYLIAWNGLILMTGIDSMGLLTIILSFLHSSSAFVAENKKAWAGIPGLPPSLNFPRMTGAPIRPRSTVCTARSHQLWIGLRYNPLVSCIECRHYIPCPWTLPTLRVDGLGFA